MDTTNLSLLRKDLFKSIDQVIEFNQSIMVNTKKGNAVIISENDYDSLMETIYLISQPNLVKNIKEGEKEDIKDMSVYNPNEDF